MRSTFMGLEASKRGLFTQQSALYTTGHNISNANTEGYSRQRVNMQPTLGYPGIGLNSPKTAGFIGTGVEAGSVQRIRDEFIDRQYRQETNKLGYWESRSNAISQMEDIMSEPSEYGLDQAFRLLWSSLQDVSANPEDAASRKVAIQRAEHLADSFNYIDTQLKQIQSNLGNEIDVSTTQINSILKQIAEINKQIQAIEPNGYMPNDLYDARDVLVDELNEYLPVSVERVPSGGNALDIAEGSLTITFKPNGASEPIILVHGKEFAKLSMIGTGTDDPEIDSTDTSNLFDHMKITWKGSATAADVLNVTGELPDATTEYKQSAFESSKGKLISLIDSYGYSDDGGTTKEGYYQEMLANLDKLANVFATVFNEVHMQGYTLNSQSTDTAPDGTFFFLGSGANATSQGTVTAASIKVNDEIINDSSKIAASSGAGEEGNGKWAIELSKLQFISLTATDNTQQDLSILGNTIQLPNGIGLEGATFQSFYRGLIGQLGVDGEESNLLKTNTEIIRLTVENNRASMSSVSLDEEMTNMIMFQQAYNANARMITVIDETLDKIINGMGRVGL